MNILYDYQTFALQSRGGISRYFSELIRGMAAREELDVAVFMGLYINEYGLQHSRESFEKFFGIRVPNLSHTLGIRLDLNATLFRYFADRVRNGIYHQTYFYNPLTRWNGKRVVTVYDMIYEQYPHEYSPDDPTARNKAMAVQLADRVICISEYTRRQLVDIVHVPEEKTSVVYLANSLTRAPGESPRIAFPYLLYVGKRGGYKNFSLLLQAYAQAAELRENFKLIAFGGGDFTREEQAQIAELNVGDRVEAWSGQDDLLADLYHYASALVYPSLSEGFGMPPLEAMHYGCPVVVSNACSVPEVVGDAGVYFDPLSPGDIAEKIIAITSDTDLRSTMIARGKKRERSFSWEKCTRETLDIYKQLS